MIYNLYKPVGWTSFDVVKKVRNITREKKVGHGGTLDPFAEGVLILGTGKDTKVLTEISGSEKSYEAELKLGEMTETLDPEGQVVKTMKIPPIRPEEVRDVLAKFLGEQTQIPPMYSAKKIDGVRLYKLARKKIDVSRKPVNINISQISLLDFKLPFLRFSVTCSKGTYIRVLGKDIAEKLNTTGYLTALIRTRIGEFKVGDSESIESFEKRWTSTAV